MKWIIQPSVLTGSISVPGDKSIAHRALILGALARGSSRVTGFPSGEAVAATASCLERLGVAIELHDGTVAINSGGGLRAPSEPLYAGNSATTMRLLMGVLSGQGFTSHLCGDRWLSRRPMERVVQPLSLMGAQIRSNGGKPPLEIEGGELRGIHYRLPVASAQVKSAVLLAGLAAEGETVVVEPVPTRDHTERLLQSLGVGLARDGGAITISGGQRPHQFSLSIPGDFSSAAFFLAGAALTRSEVTVVEVGLNPTRTAFLDVLSHMGLDVQVRNRHERTGEPVGDVTTIGSPVRPVQLGATDVPLLIDELPLVALLATQADGTSYIHGAEELRVKETDRISGVARVLSAFGGRVEELADGFAIRGPTRLRGAQVSSGGDHRLALLAAVAGAAAEGDTYVDSAEAAAVSLPEFPILFSKLGGRIDAV